MNPTAEEIAERIRAHLRENYPEHVARLDAARADESLVAIGLLDSLGFAALVSFLEETWGFRVPARDFKPAHFDTLERMIAYVQRASGKR